MNENEAWDIYNFVLEWKTGGFGLVSLQEALDNNFKEWKEARHET